MNKIGIVTVLYNSNELLADFFASLAMQDTSHHILYLVDNTPSETTRAKITQLKEKYILPAVYHIESSKNLGAAEGNNVGIKQALADGCNFIILCNNDIYFNNPTLFSTLTSKAEAEQLSIIAPKIYFAHSKKLWYAGGEIRSWQAGVKHFYDKQDDVGQADESKFAGYAPTTFMMIKATVFNTVELLDPQYFIYAEDLDLVYRATKIGHKIWYEAGLFLYHKISATTGGILSDIGFYYNTRNRVYFARKFFPFVKRKGAIFYVFISLFYHSAKQKRLSAASSFLRGFFDGLKMPVVRHTFSKAF